MATTKLWHISGNLRDVIDYAENPEKTCPIPDLEDLANAARYVQRPEATADGRFVTGINCLAEMETAEQDWKRIITVQICRTTERTCRRSTSPRLFSFVRSLIIHQKAL